MDVGTLVGILRIDDQMDEGVRRALNEAERRFGAGGEAAADRFVRGADGKIRDTLTGKFASAGDLAGTEFAREASDSMGSELESSGGGAISGWLGGLGTAVAGGAAIAGAAIGAAVVKGLGDAMEEDVGIDLLQGQLNLTDEQAAAAGRAAANVYGNNFGDSLGGVQEAVGAVWSTLGDSLGPADDALERTTERALTLAQVMGVDVGTAISTAGIAVKSGLAKDATEAIDLMTAASQIMPAEMRAELIPAVDEYGTFLATMGIKGEEAFGLLANASKDGAFGIDKTGDAIKELGIKATDMSATSVAAYEAAGLNAEDMAARFVAGGDTARGALDDVVDGLMGIEDPVERSNAAIGLFGTPLEDLNVTEIPEFLASLDTMGAGMEDAAGRTDKAASQIGDNATGKIETFKRKGLLALNDFIGGKLLPGLEGFLDKAGPIFDDLLGAWRTDGFQGVADKLGEIWEKAWPVIRQKAVELWAKIRGWLIENGPKAWAALQDAGRLLWSWIEESYPKFLEFMATLWGRVATWIAEVGVPAIGDWLKAAGPRFWQWLQDAYPRFVEIMAGLWGKVAEWVVTTGIPWLIEKGAALWSALFEWVWTEAAPALVRGLGSVIEVIRAWIADTGIPWLKEKAGEWWDALVAAAKEKGEALLTWLRELPGRIGEWITSTAIPALKTKAAEWWAVIKEKAGEKADELMTWLRGLPDRIVEAVGDLASTLVQAGRDVIQGLIDGIEEKARDLPGVLGPIAGTIVDHKGPPAKDRVLLRPAGRLIMGGLMSGIDDGVAPLRRQLDAITAGLDRDLAGSVNVGRSGMAGAASGATGGGPLWVVVESTVVSTLDGEVIGRNRAVTRGVARRIASQRAAAA